MRLRLDEYTIDNERCYNVIEYTDSKDYEPGYLGFGNYYERRIGNISYYQNYKDWFFEGNSLRIRDMERLIELMKTIPPHTKEESKILFKGDPLAA